MKHSVLYGDKLLSDIGQVVHLVMTGKNNGQLLLNACQWFDWCAFIFFHSRNNVKKIFKWKVKTTFITPWSLLFVSCRERQRKRGQPEAGILKNYSAQTHVHLRLSWGSVRPSYCLNIELGGLTQARFYIPIICTHWGRGLRSAAGDRTLA